MKKGVSKFMVFSMMLMTIVSCKNEEKELADKRISELEHYVDSLKTIDEMAINDNWNQIASSYDKMSFAAQDALSSLDEKDRTPIQERMDSYAVVYNEIKSNVESKKLFFHLLIFLFHCHND